MNKKNNMNHVFSDNYVCEPQELESMKDAYNKVFRKWLSISADIKQLALVYMVEISFNLIHYINKLDNILIAWFFAYQKIPPYPSFSP